MCGKQTWYVTNYPAQLSLANHLWVGYRTLRPQDTSASKDTLGHFGTDLTSTPKRGTRHFDTSAVIEEKPGHFDPGQFR